MPRGSLCLGGLPCACRAHIWAQNQPAAAPTKAIPGGLPPVLPSPLRIEEQEDLRSGEDGKEGSAGFPQLRPVTITLAPGLQAPWRQRAAYLGMQVSCGVKGRSGHSPGGTGLLGPERDPGKAQGLAAGAVVASPSSCNGARSCSPGHRFAAGERILRTPRTGGLRFLHGEGGSSSGGLRSKWTPSLLGWVSTDFLELKPLGPSLPPRGKVGQFEPQQES